MNLDKILGIFNLGAIAVAIVEGIGRLEDRRNEANKLHQKVDELEKKLNDALQPLPVDFIPEEPAPKKRKKKKNVRPKKSVQGQNRRR